MWTLMLFLKFCLTKVFFPLWFSLDCPTGTQAENCYPMLNGKGHLKFLTVTTKQELGTKK